MKKTLFILLLLVMTTLHVAAVRTTYLLRSGWTVQGNGKTYRTSIPTTCMGVLMKNGVYNEKLLTGLNYKSIDREQFSAPWTFTNHFTLPPLQHGQHVFLKINGLSYSANIKVNGQWVQQRDSVQGAFRQYLFDITPMAAVRNTLSIELFRAQKGDPNIGQVDWNPRPADESMGIFRDISVEVVDRVLMANPAVFSRVNTKTLKEAWLTVTTNLSNLTTHDISGTLTGVLSNGSRFHHSLTLKAGESRTVTLTAQDVKELHVNNPRLWWCNGMGSPSMYNLTLKFVADDKEVCDMRNVTFGIRSVEDYLTPEGYRGYKLNGRKVLIRGAGWTDDIFLRDNPRSYQRQIALVKDMNLNTIRLENIWGTTDDLFNLCDRNGIMIFAGWSCQWEWAAYIGGNVEDEYGCINTPEGMQSLVDQLHDQVLWLRNHPSIVCWFVGSDKLPRPEQERMYRDMLAKIDNRPILCSAKNLKSEISGYSGVKMVGPYEYVGPSYWYEDTRFGGAYGFNTETSIGAQLPVKESMKRFIPKDRMWPVTSNEYYNFHCTASTTAMNSLNVLAGAVERTFGATDGIDNFLKKADLLNYNSTRAMFEAFRVNIPHTTGIVQWMLNSAWPSLYWQLYDYYGVPTAAYYAVKEANRAAQLIYNYKDRCVYVVNETNRTKILKAALNMYDLYSHALQTATKTTAVQPYTVKKVFKVDSHDNMALLQLKLSDGNNRFMASNEYFLTPRNDEYNYDKSTWYDTPMTYTASMAQLDSVPQAKVSVKVQREGEKAEIELTNVSTHMALFNSLVITRPDGYAMPYATFSHNYFSLLPGQSRHVVCHCPTPLTGCSLVVRGWNTKEQLLKL